MDDDLRFKLVHRQPAADSNCDAQAVLNGFVAVSVLEGRYGHRVGTADKSLELAIASGLAPR